MPMDKRIVRLIAVLAMEYRGSVERAINGLEELEGEEFSPEELADVPPAVAAQLRDLAAAKKGFERALEIVDEGVAALEDGIES